MIFKVNLFTIRLELFRKSWKKCSLLIHSLSSTCGETQDANPKKMKFFSEYQSEEPDLESPYYFENGLRKVYPYYFPFTTHCKGRWINKTFIDIYCKEFGLHSKHDVEMRISKGFIKVNGKVVNQDYKLKNSDLLTSTVHRHELPVLATPIKVLHEDEDLLVVDKPPSIPVHPCGLYRYNTVIFILGQLRKWRDLHVVHRIDRLTSGVLVLSKNSEKSRKLHEEMNDRGVRKEYLCRVEGKFPDGVITCNEPIKKIYAKMGISFVSPEGKWCITEFERLSYNGKSSVVLCKPFTGRTHQIRVHLQYLGYPILNDPLYNSYVFGPDKGKHGKFHKSTEQLLEDLLVEHSSDWWLEGSCKSNSKLANDLNASNLNWEIINEDFDDRYKKDETRFTYDEHCFFCKKTFKDPNQTHLFMFLHAYKYQGENWDFKTEMPEWAASDWAFM